MADGKKSRGQFGTKLGVIATTVGSAVGLGNIWGFPYAASGNGGGAFMVVYLISTLLCGLPVMCSEFILGRGTHTNIFGAFRRLYNHKFFLAVAFMCMSASWLIPGFYSVVAGWTFKYLVDAALGNLTADSNVDFASNFDLFQHSTWECAFWALLYIIINFAICVKGVEKGIEKFSNIMTPMLFVILICMAVNACFLDGFSSGMEFLFKPDFSKITPMVVVKAVGQSFFSLSIGIGCMLIYSSYFKDSENLVKSSAIIVFCDMTVAILAGIVIFSTLFTYEGNYGEAGPGLVFCVLPKVFAEMPGSGYIWAVLFFILLFFACITSSISMFEILIAFLTDEFKMSRKKATAITCGSCVLGTMMCVLSFTVLSDFTIFGMGFFDLFQYLSECIIMPLGGLVITVFVGYFATKKFVFDQVTNHGTLPQYYKYVADILYFIVRYISPVLIILLFLYGLGLFN